MRKLTLREYILIYIALLMLAACGISWLVHATAYTTYEAAVENLEFVKMEQRMAENEIKSDEEMESYLYEPDSNLEKHGYGIGVLKTEAELEMELLRYVEKYNLSPEATTVEPVTVMMEEQGITDIYQGKMAVTVSGSIDKLCDFLGFIEDIGNMDVEDAHIKGTDDACSAEIKITCYMAEADVVKMSGGE